MWRESNNESCGVKRPHWRLLSNMRSITRFTGLVPDERKCACWGTWRWGILSRSLVFASRFWRNNMLMQMANVKKRLVLHTVPVGMDNKASEMIIFPLTSYNYRSSINQILWFFPPFFLLISLRFFVASQIKAVFLLSNFFCSDDVVLHIFEAKQLLQNGGLKNFQVSKALVVAAYPWQVIKYLRGLLHEAVGETGMACWAKRMEIPIKPFKIWI